MKPHHFADFLDVIIPGPGYHAPDAPKPTPARTRVAESVVEPEGVSAALASRPATRMAKVLASLATHGPQTVESLAMRTAEKNRPVSDCLCRLQRLGKVKRGYVPEGTRGSLWSLVKGSAK